MLAIYAKLPPEQITKDAEEAIPKIKAWFIANPKRRVCHADLWYGRRVSIRRGHVKEDVELARDNALK